MVVILQEHSRKNETSANNQLLILYVSVLHPIAVMLMAAVLWYSLVAFCVTHVALGFDKVQHSCDFYEFEAAIRYLSIVNTAEKQTSCSFGLEINLCINAYPAIGLRRLWSTELKISVENLPLFSVSISTNFGSAFWYLSFLSTAVKQTTCSFGLEMKLMWKPAKPVLRRLWNTEFKDEVNVKTCQTSPTEVVKYRVEECSW